MRAIVCIYAILVSLGLLAPPGWAGSYDVPAGFPTIQAAVAAAEVSLDLENFINLTSPVVTTDSEVVIDDSFNALRRLTIRPDPTLFLRATIVSLNGSQPIFRLPSAGYVTFQDLDIVRDTTNNNDLIVMSYAAAGNFHNVLERCRIGSTWTVPGSTGWTYLRINKPYQVVVRNCIFFSYFPGTFDVGILVFGFDDPAQSMYLYNNVVADYRVYGVYMVDSAPSTVLVLRNNVIANHPDLGIEPTAFRSNVADGVEVVSSHNVAFASDFAFVEQVLGDQIICGGTTTGELLVFDRPEVDNAFTRTTWELDPEFDDPEDNRHLFRLMYSGVLHDDSAVWGQTVTDGSPHASDLAVVDDVEKDVRPSGDPEHTDRGADQIASTTALKVATGQEPTSTSVLWAAPARNPASSVSVLYRSGLAGQLRFEVFDVTGRRLHRADQTVPAGASGRVEWSTDPPSAGVYLYRLRLSDGVGAPATVSGRITVVR